jgi:hypothetical protein
MGHWGVKSYENDEANDALDAGFERVHQALYEELMDDHNSLSFEEVQQRLANPDTLDAAISALEGSVGAAITDDQDAWDDVARLGFVGIVIRHAELGVAISDDVRRRAISWLEQEAIDWEEATLRRLRRGKELSLLKRHEFKAS